MRIFLIIAFASVALAQNPHNIDFVTSAPVGGCNIQQNLRYVTSGANKGSLYGCTTNNVWIQVTGGGGGGGTGNVTTSATLVNNQLLGGNGGVDLKPVNLAGDATTSGGLTVTLTTVNANTGTCGDGSHIAEVTLNGKGLVTACVAVAISPYTGIFTSTLGFQSTDTTNSTAFQFAGKTSGGFAIVAADAAGTVVAYVWPTAIPMSFPKSLQITGTTTCPTLAAGSPTTCYQLAWQ